MKKTLFNVAFAAMFCSVAANAQIIKSYGGMALIPGTQTNSGKGMLVVADYLGTNDKDHDYEDLDEYKFTIYDTDLHEQTRFQMQTPEIPYYWWIERAVTNVTMEQFVQESYRSISPYYTNIPLSTAQELADWLTKENGEKYVAFVDRQGKQSAIRDVSYDYWNYYDFGTVAPHDYFYIENNTIFRCYVNYEVNYEPIESVYKNWDNLNWQQVGDKEKASRRTSIADCIVCDFEKTTGSYDVDDPIPLSQNIFNSDDKWEYVLVVEEPINNTSSGYKFNEDGYLYFERTQIENVGEEYDFMIINQDGTVLDKIKLEDELCDDDEFYVYRMGGKTYLKFELHDENDDHYEALYEYTASGNGLKLVHKSRLKMSPSIVNRGERVKLELGDDVSNVTVTNSAGQVMMRQNAKGNTSIDTNRLAKGVYNVSAQQHGKASKTERFIVK